MPPMKTDPNPRMPYQYAMPKEALPPARSSTPNPSRLSLAGGLVPGYSAPKGGITQLTKSLAIAYAAEKIRVNAIAPGWIATPPTTALRENPERDTAIVGRTRLSRWGEAAEVAGGVLYLSSPLASVVTGSVLVIDGGYLIM
ncbi:SDR family NAD(P)-dependent oxidoreductase [Sinorhizobium meliloti]|uniref:SDR family NAD(P)-dependent oxidoreductase n=1 Tax=Rhizobium meliloti TaxID=382 RepID=UPI001F4557F4|nr:SDR family oxidoreductase [Sinorhizobium meliloti]